MLRDGQRDGAHRRRLGHLRVDGGRALEAERGQQRVLGGLEDAAERGFALAPESVEAIGRAEARRARWGNAALWLIAALLAVIALQLL